jgi:FkbM family methyltransferase
MASIFSRFGSGGAKRRSGEAGRRILDPRAMQRGERTKSEALIRSLCTTAYLGDRTALCRVLGRYKMYVDTADFAISSHLMLEGYWEMWLTEVLVEVVKPGMIAVDIGANLGYFTLLMADLVGGTGAVHAFEPNPPVADLLAKSIWVNGFQERVTVHRDPLGEESARNVRLHVPKDVPGGAWVAADLGDSLGLALQARRFDSYPGLMHADVIKIDAEGAEMDIWRGMSGFFERTSKPLTIFMEFAAPRYADPSGFLDEMIGRGFSLGEVSLDQGLVPRTREQVLAGSSVIEQMLVLRR